MMTYILAYQASNPQLLGLCAKPLTIVITLGYVIIITIFLVNTRHLEYSRTF